MGGTSSIASRFELQGSIDEEDSSNANSRRNSFLDSSPAMTQSRRKSSLNIASGTLNIPTKAKSPHLDYIFDGKIGNGRFCVVYKGQSLNQKSSVDSDEENPHPARVAIKEIAISDMNRQQIQIFRYELTLLTQLKHPNIIKSLKIYDPNNNLSHLFAPLQGATHNSSPTSQKVYLTMEYLKGGELLNGIIQHQTYGESDIQRIMFQLVSAVQYLHAHGIIHNNIIPENIILSRASFYSKIKLVDFSLAENIYHPKKVYASQELNDIYPDQTFIGPEYTSEEKFPIYLMHENFGQDIWSLGMILYLLLSGRLPFDDLSLHVLHPEHSFQHDCWKSVNKSIKALLCKMLQLDPKLRITTLELIEHPWIKAGKYAKEPRKPSLTEIPEGSGDEESIFMDLSSNIPLLLDFQESRQKGKVMIVSNGALQIRRTGRYTQEKNMAVLNRSRSRTQSSDPLSNSP